MCTEELCENIPTLFGKGIDKRKLKQLGGEADILREYEKKFNSHWN